MQIWGLDALVVKCQLDGRADQNGSNSSTFYMKSGNRGDVVSPFINFPKLIKWPPWPPVAGQLFHKKLEDSPDSASLRMFNDDRSQHGRNVIGGQNR